MKRMRCKKAGHSSRLSLKKTLGKNILVLLVALQFIPATSFAQGKLILGVECNSGNVWSEALLGIPTRIINGFILGLQGYDIDEMGSIPGSSITYRYNRIKVNGQKVDYDGNKTFGFKAVDLFRDFEYSLKFGWQPHQIPVGFYARVGYRHENFETRISEADEWTKHRINYLRPGIGIRISPLENLIEEYDWCPIIEIGSTYDLYLSYNGAYGNDKNQLNNGISLCVSLGAKFESGSALMLTFDRQNYNLFNKEYTVDGIKPYENTESNHFNISLSFSLGL
jgi:hypothetical protein